MTPLTVVGASTNDLTIGIDIGGTSVRAAVVDSHGAMLDTLRAATPSTVVAKPPAACKRPSHPSVG